MGDYPRLIWSGINLYDLVNTQPIILLCRTSGGVRCTPLESGSPVSNTVSSLVGGVSWRQCSDKASLI